MQITAPRHYQVSGMEFLTTKNVLSGEQQLVPTCARHILADAPGAGKTYQGSEAALKLTVDMPFASVMVLAPAHLCKQWYDYLKEQYPGERTIWLEGTRQARTKDAAKKAKFYICSIQSLRQEFYYDLLVQLFIKHSVRVTIIDESHYVKNRDAITSQRARTLTRPGFCPHVILLTATPIVKEADDLYMQLRIVDPWTFHRFDLFMNTYCWFTLGGWGYTNVVLRKDSHTKLESWLWGRTYKDIGLELPPVISYVEQHNMSKDRRKAYDDIKWYWYAQFVGAEQPLTAGSAMEVMHLLRRLTASSDKTASLVSFLEDDPGPFLIACSYKLSASMLALAVKQHASGYTPHVVTGDVDADDRREVCQAANRPNDVVIATIPAISEGVDLSHCNTVYFFEEDFTPGKMFQFLSRVRRHRDNTEGSVSIIQQLDGTSHLHVDEDPNDKPIIVRYFHAAKTIDEHIHAVQSNRAISVKDIIKVELSL